MNQSTKETLTNIPSKANYPLEIFESITQFKKAFSAITTFLDKKEDSINSNYLNSFFFTELTVEFSTKFPTEKLYYDYLNARIVIQAPKKKDEKEKSLLKRRLYYLKTLSHVIETMRTTTVSQIYLSLTAEGRKRLLSSIEK
ncbi:MAG: hypothetical protein R3B45_10265 [Bdellovibrionota bacterium]